MEKPQDIKISKFQNFKIAVPTSTIQLFQELKEIKEGKFKTEILECRKAYQNNNLELYTSLKNKLPSVTFCGVFENGRKIKDLKYYNRLMIIDIDKLENDKFNKIKELLKKDEYVLSLWTSPSGNGLKGLVKIDSNENNHKLFFNSLSRYLFEKYNIEIDKSGSDITRLCFTSWDEQIHYNKDSKTFEKIISEQTAKQKNITQKKFSNLIIQSSLIDKTEEIKLIENIITFLDNKKLSITKNYSDWRNIAFAISGSFSFETGKNLFLNICRLDKELDDESKSLELIENCYKKSSTYTGQKLTIRSILHSAKQVGYLKNLKHLL